MPESSSPTNRANSTDEQPRSDGEPPTTTRRRVLAVGAAVAGTGLASTTATAASGDLSGQHRGQSGSPGRETAGPERIPGSVWSRHALTGSYDGTIDRIVDGEHVVILIESGGETVGQEVLDRERLPDASEGDSVTLWLFRGYLLAVRVG